MADQMIFKRCEIKYMLDITQAELLKNQMKQYMTADEHGMSTICSLYFDTPDYLLIQRSMEHPVYKEKLRLRSYGTADKDTTVFVELKKKYESVVYKRRIAMTEDEAERYLLFHEKVKDTQITREIDYCLKNYKKLKETVEAIPLERILLETDCPYMAPEPHRGTRNDSSNIPFVIAKIAELKGITEEEVERVTEENAVRLFTKVS